MTNSFSSAKDGRGAGVPCGVPSYRTASTFAGRFSYSFHFSTDAGRGAGVPCSVPSYRTASTPSGRFSYSFYFSTDAGRGAGVPWTASPPDALRGRDLRPSGRFSYSFLLLHRCRQGCRRTMDRQHPCWQIFLFFPLLHRCRQGCRRSMHCRPMDDCVGGCSSFDIRPSPGVFTPGESRCPPYGNGLGQNL